MDLFRSIHFQFQECLMSKSNLKETTIFQLYICDFTKHNSSGANIIHFEIYSFYGYYAIISFRNYSFSARAKAMMKQITDMLWKVIIIRFHLLTSIEYLLQC